MRGGNAPDELKVVEFPLLVLTFTAVNFYNETEDCIHGGDLPDSFLVLIDQF